MTQCGAGDSFIAGFLVEILRGRQYKRSYGGRRQKQQYYFGVSGGVVRGSGSFFKKPMPFIIRLSAVRAISAAEACMPSSSHLRRRPIHSGACIGIIIFNLLPGSALKIFAVGGHAFFTSDIDQLFGKRFVAVLAECHNAYI